MSLEKQEVARTFQDQKGAWIPFRFQKLTINIVCEIKTKRGWKEYGQGTSEIAALREAKEKWNVENGPLLPQIVPFKPINQSNPF